MMAGTLDRGVNRSRSMVVWALIVATAVTVTLLGVFALSHTPSRSATTPRRVVAEDVQPTVRQLEPRAAAARIGQPTVRQLEPRAAGARVGRPTARQLEPRRPGPQTSGELRRLDQDEMTRFLNRVGAGSQ